MSEIRSFGGTLDADKEIFRIFAEASPLGISFMRNDGTYEYVNPRFVELFGYTLDDLVHRDSWLHRAFPDPVNRLKASSAWIKYLEVSSPGQHRQYTFQVRCKDGSDKMIKFWPVTIETGRQMVIYEDLTERKLLERQLIQAQKMEAMGALAGGIAHDFNNILSAIMGNAEIALYHLRGQSTVRYSIEQILKASYRARDLTQQILAFSRQTEQELKPTKVGSIVKEALKLVRASLPASIDIILNDIAETDTVLADPTQIHQVLINLCTNAQHAMGEDGGVLEVGLSNVEPDLEAVETYPDLKRGYYLKLTISDTGQGISQEIMDKIFDPYFTTKAKGVGTGLGLTVIHGIVKSLGGVITVSSEPGRGTTFEVLLPLVEPEDTKEYVLAERIPLGNERVLFVDDEDFLADLGGRMLEQLGYEVTLQTDSLKALEVFKARPDDFDLVITDMAMPHLTGDKLAQQLLLIRPDIPIILCTGFSARVTEERARELGIQGYLLKPFVTEKMATTIRRVMEKKSS